MMWMNVCVVLAANQMQPTPVPMPVPQPVPGALLPAERPAAVSPAQAVSQERLMKAVEALPTKRATGPTDEHVQGLLKTQEWLAARLRDLGYRPKLIKIGFKLRDGPAQPEWQNIEVEIPGREEAEKVLLIGAHFDSHPDAPGADDNGTGVAAVLELARVLQNVPMRRTVRLVLFNLEERAGNSGLHGSTQYATVVAEAVRAGEIDLIGMLSLEMLGYYSDEPGSQQNPFEKLNIPGFEMPDRGDFIGLGTTLPNRALVRGLAAAMREAEPKVKVVVFDYAPVPTPDLMRSDHAPFLLQGLPGVIVTDTANFRNPHYHQPSDTVATLDAARFTITVRALAGAIHQLAGPIGEQERWPLRPVFDPGKGGAPPTHLPDSQPRKPALPKPVVPKPLVPTEPGDKEPKVPG